ncbi:MAG: hypothetical protein EOP84_06525 [Verrucomicrobiaceae bacterium]|nr:MAG: hypothetical protein EOP84_06525 [Verrucomicrobiaceae bacterium]
MEHVANTSIFVRPVGGGDQAVIYSMEINAQEDLSMILPIPVAQPSRENSVRFVSLKDYPNIFAGLRRGFPRQYEAGPAAGNALGGPPSRSAPLRVVQVGNFVASFVPTVADFSRLDEQFRLPEGVWEKLGGYAKFGFAVFKLRKGHSQIHPMAFVFPSANPDHLFFPTVHIHDGEIHPRAEFDHVLYCQVARRGLQSLAAWDESELPANRFVNAKMTHNLILPDHHVFRRTMLGEFANADVLLRVA